MGHQSKLVSITRNNRVYPGTMTIPSLAPTIGSSICGYANVKQSFISFEEKVAIPEEVPLDDINVWIFPEVITTPSYFRQTCSLVSKNDLVDLIENVRVKEDILAIDCYYGDGSTYIAIQVKGFAILEVEAAAVVNVAVKANPYRIVIGFRLTPEGDEMEAFIP